VGVGPREIIFGSVYLLYVDVEPAIPGELDWLMTGFRANRTHQIVGCDANSQHTSKGNMNINNRGESLLNQIMANGLDIMNRGNKHTFITYNRQDVIEITILTVDVGNFTKDWHLTEEVSCSDHTYFRFIVTGIERSVEDYRNKCRTDWGSFRTDLLGCLCDMIDKISNLTDNETASKQFQDAIFLTYNEKFPFTMRKNNRNIWLNQDLVERRKKVHRLLNVAKKSGKWTAYKRTLIEYNKPLRQLKRKS